MRGYGGRILTVDLTRATSRVEPLDAARHVLYAVAGQVVRSGRSNAPGVRPTLTLAPGSFSVYLLEP